MTKSPEVFQRLLPLNANGALSPSGLYKAIVFVCGTPVAVHLDDFLAVDRGGALLFAQPNPA
jgi:hypothetical protein